MIKRIVYMSSAAPSVGAVELSDILRASRENNKAADITGLLLFHENTFFQVLEGPADAVDACYARIYEDKRHVGCIDMSVERAPGRAFSAWSMGYVPPKSMTAEQMSAFFDIREIFQNECADGLDEDPTVRVLVDNFLGSFSVNVARRPHRPAPQAQTGGY